MRLHISGIILTVSDAAAAVRLSSWAIKSTGSKGHAPRKVKLFINKPSLGFSEAGDFPAAQEFMLSEADLEGKPLQLKCALPTLPCIDL